METLSKTNAVDWEAGTCINLEPALRMGDELGGHLLSGHVDGLARVISSTSEADSLRLVFEVPGEFGVFIAPKGSIAVDGVSLTINGVDDLRFDVNLIPHTRMCTTLSTLAVGGKVNIEVDMIARYLERQIRNRKIDP